MLDRDTGLKLPAAAQNRSVEIYRVAKRQAGQHLTLDNSVSYKEGCGQSVSAILLQAGIPEVPAKGIKGTIGLNAFLMDHPQVEEIVDPEPGAIIVSVAAGNREGHTGIFADFDAGYPGDWTILSNDSNTGTLRDQWCFRDWLKHYGGELNLRTFLYRWRG